MHNPQTRFGNLLSPVLPEDFFKTYLGRKPLHIPGNPDKFAGLFDWADLNRVINSANIWNANTFKMVLDNEQVPADVYMPQGVLDAKEVSKYIEQGASVVLSGIESYTEGSAAIAASLQAAVGGTSQCNLYCSFKQHPGFLPHFDLMDVFVFQIDGEKDWDIFETHFDNPMLKPGCHQMSFTREQHAENKGHIEKQLTMKPGDVLYIPKGKYHAAVASSEHSLHITYGLESPRALHVIESVVESLYMDSAFRQEMPHYENSDSYDQLIDTLAEKFRARMTSPEAKQQIRHEHARMSFRNIARFDLPGEGVGRNFRVRTTGTQLKRRGKNWQLHIAGKTMELSGEHAALIEWMLNSELFKRAELFAAFPELAEHNGDTLITLLKEFGFLTEI